MSKSADAFRTISEVAEWLDTPAHVLRFWESKFTQVKPVKRAGGRRYYRPQDMMLLGGIKKLLHDDGMTIKHVQKLLRQEGVKHVASLSANPSDASSYAVMRDEPMPEPEPEVSRVVSFKPMPDPETPAEAPAPEEVTPDEPAEATLPFPSFLSGGEDTKPALEEDVATDEPVAEPEPEPEAEQEAAAEPVAEAVQQVADETPAQGVEDPEDDGGMDIISIFTNQTSSSVRAHEAELRPVMERIRDRLAQMS